MTPLPENGSPFPEPVEGPWRWSVVPLADLAARVATCAGDVRPAVVALNGHSSSGKTTLSGRLAAALPHAAVLHSDDLAWHQGVFGWGELLLRDVLPVVRAGRPLSYRPPQWAARQRDGAIELPGDLEFLVLEGVGASHPTVAAGIDVIVWVETDEPTRLARDLPRIAAGETSQAGYDRWMAEENAYVTAHRPWEQAHLVAHGGGLLDHDPRTHVLLRT